MLGHVTSQLRYFYLLLEVSFEASEDDLSLAGLEAIDDGRDGSVVILIREMDELLIHELFVANDWSIVDHDKIRIIRAQPLFPLLRVLLAEDQLHS